MSDEFDPHLSCSDIKTDRSLPSYISKTITMDSTRTLEVTTPFKTFEMNALSKKTYPFFSKIKNPIFFDNAKCIYHPKTYNAINELNEGYINDVSSFLARIGIKPKLLELVQNSYSSTSIVFHRDPFKERHSSGGNNYPALSIDNFETFLNNLYAYSKGLVLTPDINIANIPKQGYTISSKDYIKYINHFVDILSGRNNKPIFVPIQTNLTKKATKEILDFYHSKGYSNIWVDFYGGEVRGRHVSGFRSILNILDKQYEDKNYVLLCSHMRKEMSPDIRDNRVPPSDMLSQFVGGDIIGGTREPIKGFSNDFNFDGYIKKLGFSNKKEYEYASFLNKSRIFDPDSYYYYLPTAYPDGKIEERRISLDNKDINHAIDNIIKYNEIENVKNKSVEENNLKEYLKERKLFIDSEELYNDIINYAQPNTLKKKSLFDGL